MSPPLSSGDEDEGGENKRLKKKLKVLEKAREARMRKRSKALVCMPIIVILI